MTAALARARGIAASPLLGVAVVGLIGFLARLPFIFDRRGLVYYPDMASYFRVSDALLRGELFYRGSGVQRSIGYPVFVLIADILPGRREANVVLVQHLLGIAFAVGVFLVARRYFGVVAAWLSSIMVALSPLTIRAEDDALADFSMALALFAAGAAIAFVALKRPEHLSRRWFAGLGAVIAFVAIMKPAGLFVLFAPLLAFAAARWPWRQIVRGQALVVATVLLVLSPWIVHGLIRYGSPSISDQSGVTLFSRVFEDDQRPIPQDTQWGVIAEQARVAEMNKEGFRVHSAVSAAIAAQGVASDDVPAIMRELAVEAIKEYPFEYARLTVKGTDNYLDETHRDGRFDLSFRVAESEMEATKADISNKLLEIHRGMVEVWWFVGLNGALALVALVAGPRRSRVAAASFAAIWVLSALGTSATHGGNFRYWGHLVPITTMLVIAGATGIAGAIWRDRRRRAERATDVAPSSSP